jgi:hypothetical protein
VGSFSERRAGINRYRGVCGYIDKAGRSVVESKFHYVDEFSEGLAVVAGDGFLFRYIAEGIRCRVVGETLGSFGVV